MCGRLTLKTPPSQWTQLLLPAIDFEAFAANWQPRYNIAPTQDIVAILRSLPTDEIPAGRLEAAYCRWGLVPNWATDLAIGSRMINARHETLGEKKSFVGPLAKRRCLVIVDGYYEWQKLDDKTKQPHWISPTTGGVMQLAGLWEVNTRATGQPIRTCTIVTTAANARLSSIHDRMPVPLEEEAAASWLDLQCDASAALGLLGPAREDFFHAKQVSQHVNNARHEDAGCLN